VADNSVDINPIGPDPGTVPFLSNAGPVAQPRHFSLYTGGDPSNASRYMYKGNWSSPSTGFAYNGHGQMVMSVLGGFVPNSLDQGNSLIHRDAKGFRYGMGVAPFVRLGNSVVDGGLSVPGLPMVAAAYASGARMSTNSWLGGGSGEYSMLAQAYDAFTRDALANQPGLQPMFFAFAAGNSGSSEQSRTMGEPATAKNVLSVGASEGVRSKAASAGGLPRNDDGLGAVNLGHAFDGVQRVIRDQVDADTFTDSGQTRTVLVAVTDASKPFRVSMVYTDAPGSTVGSAFVNDLNLTVTRAGKKYLGNVFSKEYSTTGGRPDPRNNAEHVFLPTGLQAGEVISIRVQASAINGDGITGNSDPTDQDFALVVYNATPVPDQAVLAFERAEVVSLDNNSLQPNDCHRVRVELRNSGTLAATNVSTSLQSTNPGLTINQGVDNFPLINPDTVVSGANDYRLSSSGALQCGSTVNFSHQVTVGGLSFTTPIEMRVGTPTSYDFRSTNGQIPSGGALIPETNFRDHITSISAPFVLKVYDRPVAAGEQLFVSSNGFMQLNDGTPTSWHLNEGLPSRQFQATTIAPYWDELAYQSVNGSGVNGSGIYQQVLGSAPNRTWIVEWRAKRAEDAGTNVTVNFAIAFQENSETMEFIYQSLSPAPLNGMPPTVGIQSNDQTQPTFTWLLSPIVAGRKYRVERIAASCARGAGSCAVQADQYFSSGFE
jgi:hypothetical protein